MSLKLGVSTSKVEGSVSKFPSQILNISLSSKISYMMTILKCMFFFIISNLIVRTDCFKGGNNVHVRQCFLSTLSYFVMIYFFLKGHIILAQSHCFCEQSVYYLITISKVCIISHKSEILTCTHTYMHARTHIHTYLIHDSTS